MNECFSDPQANVTEADWDLLRPCEEAAQALFEYEEEFPLLTNCLRQSMGEAVMAFLEWKEIPLPRATADYHSKRVAFSRIVFETAKQIASATGAARDTRKQRAVELWDEGKHTWREIAEAIDSGMDHNSESVKSFTQEIYRYSKSIGHTLRKGQPGSKKQTRE